MLDVIKNRRSIRRFKKQTVDEKVVKEIIEAGTWAPSGLKGIYRTFFLYNILRLPQAGGRG